MAQHNNNVLRVFISSTFSDFHAECEVLQRNVFPRLAAACKAHGTNFLGVDLRWVISPERARHNLTMQTCLEKIERCRRLSPKPNLLILITGFLSEPPRPRHCGA